MTTPDARSWLFLTASTVFEVVWIVSLRMTEGFTRLTPLLVYAISGLGAAVCLSVAMKIIPMGTAYAFWMGASVVGVLVVDVAWFKQPWDPYRVACALLIIAGTCGLQVARAR